MLESCCKVLFFWYLQRFPILFGGVFRGGRGVTGWGGGGVQIEIYSCSTTVGAIFPSEHKSAFTTKKRSLAGTTTPRTGFIFYWLFLFRHSRQFGVLVKLQLCGRWITKQNTTGTNPYNSIIHKRMRGGD